MCTYSGVESVADVAASAVSSLQKSHMQLYTCVHFRLNYTVIVKMLPVKWP